jgi:hypothetical protein
MITQFPVSKDMNGVSTPAMLKNWGTIFLMYMKIHKELGAKSYIEKGFLICEEDLVTYKKEVSQI